MLEKLFKWLGYVKIKNISTATSITLDDKTLLVITIPVSSPQKTEVYLENLKRSFDGLLPPYTKVLFIAQKPGEIPIQFSSVKIIDSDNA